MCFFIHYFWLRCFPQDLYNLKEKNQKQTKTPTNSAAANGICWMVFVSFRKEIKKEAMKLEINYFPVNF